MSVAAECLRRGGTVLEGLARVVDLCFVPGLVHTEWRSVPLNKSNGVKY